MAPKKLTEIAKAVDEQLRGIEIDPLASVLFGGDDEVSALPSEPDDEPFAPPMELSRAEKRQLDTESAANEGFFRMFGNFGNPELDGDFRMTAAMRDALAGIEKEAEERFLGPARKAQDPLDEFIQKATDGFVRFLRRRGTIDISTFAKRAPGSRDGSYVRRGSESERAARTERDGGLVSEYNSSGALIRAYEV